MATKSCIRCGSIKPYTLDYFVKSTQHKSGLTSACRTCCSAAVAASRSKKRELYNERDRLRHAANRNAILERKRVDYTNNKEKYAARRKANKIKYPEREAARKKLHQALISGLVMKWPACAAPNCDSNSVEAHHPDYSKPLDVVWLCKGCHRKAHAVAH